MSVFDTYKKAKDYLICVDSDGCAMDTMDIKHIRCFGPCMVQQWGLKQWEEEILARWNDINLYTMTRGINRFKGLSVALQEIDKQYTEIEDLSTLVDWVQNSDELSNDALKRAIDTNPESVSLKKALSWSESVNASIKLLPQEEIKPFELVKEALEFAHNRADIAIVSSANLSAVLEEWEKHGLLKSVDIVLAQDSGSKAYCISQLLKKGYSAENVLMCGDAPGDLSAAQSNCVNYYPILVRFERESWQEFMDIAFKKLLDGTYSGEYQVEKIKEFNSNLGN
ncbi:MAG: HAD family hydrolase [Ruminococcaceae bacterium]|nr:HAD family hydrolase [Oscillospiraceae bacterium]